MRKIVSIPLIIISIPIGLVLLTLIYSVSYRIIKSIKYNSIIGTEEFQSIEKTIANNEEILSFSLLPHSDLVVINGTVINQDLKLFGSEPELTFYMNYYSAPVNPYNSLDSLLSTISCPLNSEQVEVLKEEMATIKLQDIFRNEYPCPYVSYWWKNSMWGDEGIIQTKCKINELQLDDRTKLKELKEGYYKFTS